MKTFDYRTSRVKDFTIIFGDTIKVWKQLEFIDAPMDLRIEQRAALGYFVVMSTDDAGHLEPRDCVMLLGDGSARLLFPQDADVAMRYWSDVDLSNWYRSNKNDWHRVRRATRKR